MYSSHYLQFRSWWLFNSLKNFLLFWNLFNPILSQLNPVSILQIHLILFSYLSSNWFPPLRFSGKNLVCISYFSHVCYLPYPSHPSWSVHLLVIYENWKYIISFCPDVWTQLGGFTEYNYQNINLQNGAEITQLAQQLAMSWMTGILIPSRSKSFSVCQHVQTWLWAHPASYPVSGGKG